MPRQGNSTTAARLLRSSLRNALSTERRRRTPTRSWCRYSGSRPAAAPATLAPTCSSAAPVRATKATPAVGRSGRTGWRHLRGVCTGRCAMLRRIWGGRRDSNPQQLESQSRTLPLSYGHHCLLKTCKPYNLTLGLPGGTRTHNPQLRRLVLYPVELRADLHPPSPLPGAGLVGVERF